MENNNSNLNSADQLRRRERAALVGICGVVLLTAVLAIIGFCFINKPDEVIQGQADATSVTISGKLPGRVVDFFVHEGDMVHAGDTLVHIHSSLAEAQLMRAKAMETAAEAQNSKIDEGTRVQIVDAARDMVSQAAAAVEITKKTFDRMDNLWRQGVVSEQKRDEASAAYKSAVAAHEAAKSQLSLAVQGAQKQDKTSAAAMVTVAKGGVAEVNSVLEDQYLIAPFDGRIDQVYPEVGELVSLGAPIMSLLRLDKRWVTFNVREELLDKIPLGTEIEVMIPALDKRHIKAKVFYIRDMGSYATWRSTKATGEWDSRTFCIKARPAEGDSVAARLLPGMSVILTSPVH